MKAPDHFKLAETKLEPGITAIEASAGTGKTFTIAGIILRLILEQDMRINQILAVTYTVAATEELRDRVRNRLRDALRDLRLGESRDEIVAKHLRDRDVPQACRALDAAIQNFDEAQIFTIHGFCQRMLGDNAFESGLLFDMELMPDPEPILAQVARDFWRRTYYNAQPLISRLALAHGRSPEEWAALLRRMQNHPDLAILPAVGNENSATLAAALEKHFDAIKKAWQTGHAAICEILDNDKGLSRALDKFSAEKCATLREDLTTLCERFDEANPACLLAIEDLSSSNIEACKKGQGAAPQHRFFDLCEDFKNAVVRFFQRLNHEFVDFAKEEMPSRKAKLNALTYDDLLLRLRNALDAPLIQALGIRYRAALIDEFQDTDPLQYEIFRKLFGGGHHQLYLIGDPKQAIYAFRGADVFTYLDAARKAQREYTLATNYRSEKPLLDGINTLFGNREDPFLVKEIRYYPVSPPEKPRADFAELLEKLPPLRFRYAATRDKPLNQGDAERLISRTVVADIARLGTSGAQLGARSLRFGDMAILVRSNRQAAKLQAMLREHGINSVLKSDESVFNTAEARDLSRLLEAVIEPGRDTLLKTALATCIVGLDAARIAALDASESERSAWLERFLAYRTIWESGCFIALFRHILVDLEVRRTLLQWPGGERRLTNLLHLAELLHTAETGLRMTPDALCAWLRKQRKAPEKREESHQLRLESDDDAVLISTIHKSKGLEYPVVFCPFLWKPADSSRRTELLFHDPAAADRLTLDLRSPKEVPEHDRLTEEERTAESLRVLYVAVTRAKNRCQVYAGDISKFAESPLSYLLAGATFDSLAKAAPDAIATTLIDPNDDVALSPVKTETIAPAALRARPFDSPAPQGRMIASFTGLVSEQADETPDRDAVPLAEPAVETDGDLAELGGFERGARAGNFIHEVLEKLDFQAPEQLERLVPRTLGGHGIPAGIWAEKIRAQILRMLEAPLAPGLALNRIAIAARKSEVEFSHPIAPLQPRQLQALFAKHAGPALPHAFPAHLGRLKFQPVEGFMRGFIDLLFEFGGRYYIVDWKSNWLGNRRSDYDQPGIAACMLRHSYYLQYHLYTVATDLFLQRRLPGYQYEQHFGGVFYLFIRGIDPAQPDRGIFKARPGVALISELRHLLTTGKS